MLQTEVLIVGAGPVGLTLAMFLRQRGVDVLLVERRGRDEPANARCNTIASRTMEIWRRLGVADKVRASGLTDDYPGDVTWSTRLNGHEIARIPLASRSTRFADMSVADAAWPTPEPVHRASQYEFDPILREHAEHVIGVPLHYRCELLDFEQNSNGVTARIAKVDGGEFSIAAKLLVGCDGGRSLVRKKLGIEFVGDAELFRHKTRLLRAPWMRDHIKGRPGWMNWFVGPGATGTLIAINGTDLWLCHVPYKGTEAVEVDFDTQIRQALCLRPEQQYETIEGEDWVARRFVAERFRKGRVFICGDAAHIWVPFAGYGMNAGVADAENLANCISSYFQGWAGEDILACYEAERHPVTEQVSMFAMNVAMDYVQRSIKGHASAVLDDDGEEGRVARQELGQKILEANIAQYSCAGLNYAYFYDNSPLIAYDGDPAPTYDLGTYTPSTVPGCRMPHFWRPDGASLYDLLADDGYTLVRFDPEVPVHPLTDAATGRNLPLAVLDIWNPDPRLFRQKIVLVRADRHIAWRGDELPEDPARLIDRLRAVQKESIRP